MTGNRDVIRYSCTILYPHARDTLTVKVTGIRGVVRYVRMSPYPHRMQKCLACEVLECNWSMEYDNPRLLQHGHENGALSELFKSVPTRQRLTSDVKKKLGTWLNFRGTMSNEDLMFDVFGCRPQRCPTSFAQHQTQ
jgi:hypothetical protein